MLDPGPSGGGGWDGVVYDDTFFVNTKTSLADDDGGVSGGSYSASGGLIAAYVNNAVTDIGPCNGKYDPELSAIFGEEI